MKKLFFAFLLLFGFIGNVTAQEAYNIGSYKAKDRKEKGDKMLNEHTAEAVEQANALYKEAEDLIQKDIEETKIKGNNAKLAKLYIQNAELQETLLNPQIALASSGMPFDTLAFCQRVDNIITSYNAASEYNSKPNAKGKVKSNADIARHAKFGVMTKLTLYYNCGAFKDAMGDKQGSLDYFQKFVDLPQVSPVFSEAERDSIYRTNAQIYGTARFNLALQNFYLKNWDKAITACDEALKDTANIHDLYLIKINSYGEKKDSAAWQRTLVEAAQRTGKSSYLQNLLYYYMQNNKITEATALADQLVKDYPNDKMTWYIKGAIDLNIKRDYAASRTSFEKALAIDPDFEDALFNMGTAYINDIYEQSSSGKFKYIGTNKRIEGKGQAAYNKEKAIYDKELATVKSYYEKAKPYLEHLRELTPNDAKRWASPLQMVYSSLGMKDQAKEMDALLETANQSAQ